MANWKKINNKIKSADSFQDIDMTKLKEYVFSRSRAMVMVTTDGLLYNYNYTKDYFEYIDTSSIEDEIKSVKIVGDNIFVTTNTNKLYQVNVSSASKPQDSGVETPPEDSGDETPPEDSGDETPPEDSGVETPPEDSGDEDSGDETPPEDSGDEDSGDETPPEDSGVVTPPEDSGVVTPPSEDSGVETPPEEDSGVVTPPEEDIDTNNNNVKEIISNNGSSYLITNDDNLYVCGSNNYGQLGVGNTTNILTWTKITTVGIINNVKEVITNNIYSSYLITLDNNLYVCGYNSDGGLGVGNTTNVLTWTKIDIEDIADIVKEVIINDIYSSYLITNDNNLYVCGYNYNGQLGLGNNTNVLTWTKIDIEGINNNVKEVISNNYSSYLITNDNNLYVCGDNIYGQLGVGNTGDVLTWTKIDIEDINNNVKEVIININNSSYLITNDDNLYVCGNNTQGQLGVGNNTDVKTWTKIDIEGINNNVKEVIITNNNSSYLITKDNNLYVCGNNDYGQLGLGDTTDVLTWTKIDIVGVNNNVKEVIININNSSYLITKDNNLYVCGYNYYGQLGIGNTDDVKTWTKITLTGIIDNVKEVIINNNSSYLITKDNNLYVCGNNGNGQLGVGNATNVLTWTEIDIVGIVDNVKEVIINNGSSYLITNDNNLYLCGSNNSGQLGFGDTINRMKYELIELNEDSGDSGYEDSGVETPPSIDIL